MHKRWLVQKQEACSDIPMPQRQRVKEMEDGRMNNLP